MTDTILIASRSLQATFDARDGFHPGVAVANHSAKPVRLKVTIDGSAERLALCLIDGPGPVPAHET